MSDAAHLLSDALSFLISYVAARQATQPSPVRLSFGQHRTEILGGLASVMAIWAVTGVLLFEAVGRIRQPEEVDGKLMFIVALLGLGVNLLLLLVLGGHNHVGLGHSHHGHHHMHDHAHADDHGHNHGHSHESHCHKGADALEEGGPSRSVPHQHSNLNMRGAILHVLGDIIQSLGVLLAGVLIWSLHDQQAEVSDKWWSKSQLVLYVDPLCTFLFALLVLLTTRRLLADIYYVLMEASPEGLNLATLRHAFLQVPHVVDVHDLHVWSLTPGITLMSAHVTSEDGADNHTILRQLEAHVTQLNIHHSTIQICPKGVALEQQ